MSSYHIIQWHFNKLNASNFHSYSKGLFLLLLFIAFLIILHALFLLVHFCCRRFSQQPATAAAIAATVVISPLPHHQCDRVDYTNDHIMLQYSTSKSLSSMVGEGFEKKECCICLSVLQDNEQLKVLTECKHVYHSECLDMWLSAHPNCPLCRASLYVSNSLKKSSSYIT